MANYNNLKAGIDAVIKTNGRQEISGAALNTQLKNMITELGAGYQFMGVATPATNPDTPDANVFYLASEAGTYTNFGGIVINEGEVCALVWNGTWTKQVTGAATADKLNQLGQKVTAFSGTFSVNSEQNTLSISGGYAFIGEDPYTVADQVINFSSVGYLNYILLTASAGAASFSIQPYDTPIADNQYIVGYITGTKKVELYSTMMEGENWVTKQAKFSSFPTSCAISVDESAKTISISNGYVFIGSSAYQISAHSISFAGLTSLNYIYFNAITGKFGISPFNTPLSANSYICGYATSAGKAKMTNQNFDEALIKSQIGTPSIDILPSADYLDGAFGVPQGGGAADIIYYDTRYIINKTKKISKLSILAYSAGTINVYFVAMDNTIVTSIPISVVAGRNDIPITLPEQYYDQAMYVGINSDGIYWNMASDQPETYNAKLTISTGVVTHTSYASAYAIEIVDTSDLIRAKVDALSPFTDINEALASGVNDIVLAGQDFEISSPIVMREGMTIRGSFGKTRLILTNGCTTAISASNVNNIKISDLEIVGTCPNYWYEMNGIVAGDGYTLVADEDDAVNMRYMGSEKGIYLYYCENVILENLKINHIDGSAIRVNHTGMDYTKGLNASNLFISNCYNGIYTENEHEFSQYTNFTITICMVGLYVTSGSLIFTAGHLTRCRVAVEYVGGYNHAHGICNGLEIKHNQVAGIICTNIANGQQFTGCYVSYCNVIIRDSKGVTFDALTMGQGTIICSGNQGGAGGNYIITLFNRTGSVSIQNTGNLQVQQNINLDLLPN